MRTDFCVFILTHGRPDNVPTLKHIRLAGYTGRVILLLDNEDKSIQKYRGNFPDEEIVVFDKRKVSEEVECGDNFDDLRTVLYARNACFDVAERLGIEYFIELDDDYRTFFYRLGPSGPGVWKIRRTFDGLMTAMVEFLEVSGALSVAMAQGGDYLTEEVVEERGFNAARKAMNSFVCKTSRRFDFVSRLNDDVSTYLTLGARGKLFFTIMMPMLTQAKTQSEPGGLTEAYLDFGTYVKSFYSVMYAPSCTSVGSLGARIHHKINWNYAVPKILREDVKRG